MRGNEVFRAPSQLLFRPIRKLGEAVINFADPLYGADNIVENEVEEFMGRLDVDISRATEINDTQWLDELQLLSECVRRLAPHSSRQEQQMEDELTQPPVESFIGYVIDKKIIDIPRYKSD